MTDNTGDNVSELHVKKPKITGPNGESEQELLEAEIKKLHQRNANHLQRLAAANFQIDGITFNSLYTDAIVEYLFPEGSIERARLQMIFESKVSAMLDEAEEHFRKAQLTQGIHLPNGHKRPKGV